MTPSQSPISLTHPSPTPGTPWVVCLERAVVWGVGFGPWSFVSPSGMVEIPHLRAKHDPSPSPWMGEGGDGGGRNADSTPTLVLPHAGGGKFLVVGFEPRGGSVTYALRIETERA